MNDSHKPWTSSRGPASGVERPVATLGAVTRAMRRRIPDDVWVVAPDA